MREEHSSGSLDGRGVYCRPRHIVPPMGVMPRKLWLENRCDDIMEAMERYRRNKSIIPVEWVEELAEHLWALHPQKTEFQTTVRQPSGL